MKINKDHIFKFLFECLAIFASVLAAFLIDEYRKGKEESNNQLLLLAELTADLRNDSIKYADQQKTINGLTQDLKKIIFFLEKKDNQIDSIGSDYPLTWAETLHSNPTTYESLKNTGGFKFISDKKITGGLLSYYDERNFLNDKVEKEMLEINARMREFLIRHVKFRDRNGFTVFLFDKTDLKELIGNQELINLCYIKKLLLEGMRWGLVQRNDTLNKLIINCDAYLKKMS